MTDSEITRLLAERVMGWEVVGPTLSAGDRLPTTIWRGDMGDYWKWEDRRWRSWRPLDSLDDAWMLVDQLKNRPEGRLRIVLESGSVHSDQYYVGFARYAKLGVSDRYAYDPTPQRAICLAALRAVGVEVDDA